MIYRLEMEAFFIAKQQEPNEEEKDLLERSKHREKEDEGIHSQKNEDPKRESMQHQRSYKDSVLGRKGGSQTTKEDLYADGNVLDDDIIEESNGDSCFGIGMTKEEKMEA